jgi:hypothetical protein
MNNIVDTEIEGYDIPLKLGDKIAFIWELHRGN